MNLFAEYAEDLNCAHCGAKNRAEKWPEQGDLVPFYNQKEPGQYTVTVHCPDCNKDWYVVWDDNPGAIRQLQPSPTPTASPQPAPDPARADALAQQGMECLRAGNADEAMGHLSLALQHDANHFGALQSLGLAHGMKGDHAQAATHLEAALRVKSNDAPAHFNLGIVYLKQGKTAEAIQKMEAALQLKPDYPQAQQALGKLRAAAPQVAPTPRPQVPQTVTTPKPAKPAKKTDLKSAIVCLCEGCKTRYVLGVNAVVVTMDDAMGRIGMSVGGPLSNMPDSVTLEWGEKSWPEGVRPPRPKGKVPQSLTESRQQGKPRRWQCDKCKAVQAYDW